MCHLCDTGLPVPGVGGRLALSSDSCLFRAVAPAAGSPRLCGNWRGVRLVRQDQLAKELPATACFRAELAEVGKSSAEEAAGSLWASARSLGLNARTACKILSAWWQLPSSGWRVSTQTGVGV